MKPSVDLLQDSSTFECLDLWEHTELVSYVQQYLRKLTLISGMYFVLTFLSLVAVGFAWYLSGLEFSDALSHVGLGIAAAYLLIIPHEHIHALAYRYFGAKNIRIHYNIRQLTALCISDREVFSGYELAIIAIAPFAVITTLGLFALLIIPYPLFLLAGLAFHTAACSGDAAILNYIWLRRHEELYTYDDDTLKQTFFFRALEQLSSSNLPS